MHASSELFIVLFIPSHRSEMWVKKMKNEKNMRLADSGAVSIKMLFQLVSSTTLALLTDHSLTINRYSCGQMFRQRHHSQN